MGGEGSSSSEGQSASACPITPTSQVFKHGRDDAAAATAWRSLSLPKDDFVPIGTRTSKDDQRWCSNTSNSSSNRSSVDEVRERTASRSSMEMPRVLSAPPLQFVPGSASAQRHDLLTFIFADVVGFTTLCATAPAMEMVTLLDQMFTAFDGRLDDFGVLKGARHARARPYRLLPSVPSQSFCRLPRVDCSIIRKTRPWSSPPGNLAAARRT